MERDLLGLNYSIIQFTLIALGIFAILLFIFRLISNVDENILAARNIIRNARRSILILIAVCCAVAANILLGNYFLDMFSSLRESTIRSELGHVQIMKKGYLEKGFSSPFDFLIENPEEIEQALLADPEIASRVTFITTQLNFTGIITGPNAEKSLNYLGKAVESTEDSEFALFDIYKEGTPLDSDGFAQVSLGEGLASQLDVNIGDYVTILAITPGGGFDLLDAELTGIISTFVRDRGNVLLKTSQEFAHELLRTDGVNNLIVVLNDTSDDLFIHSRIEQIVAQRPEWEVEVYLWKELTEFYHEVRKLFSDIYFVVSTILFLMITFLILNTISMSVFERFSEFGTLRSIGLRKKELVSLVVLEGIYIGIIGSILGVFLASVIGNITYSLGALTSTPPGYARSYPIDIRIHIGFQYAFLTLMSMLSCIGTSLIASWIPARKAAGLQIVDSIRTNQ